MPQRAKAAEEVKGILARIKSDVQFELLAHHAAARLGIDDEIFRRARAGAPAPPRAQTAPLPKPSDAAPKWPVAERTLVEVIAMDRQAAEWISREGGVTLLSSPDLAEAGRKMIDAWDRDRPIADVVATFPDALARRLAAVLVGGGPFEDTDRMKLASECVQRLRSEASRARRLALAAEVRRAERSGDESWRDKLETLGQLRREEEEVDRRQAAPTDPRRS